MPQPLRIYQVAVPAPLYRLFDYLAPESVQAAPGARVRVPFGRRETTGVLINVSHQSDLPRARLKRVAAVLDTAPLLPSPLLKLLGWAAGYYHYPIGEALHTALPVLLRQGRPAVAAGERIWRLSSDGAQVDSGQLARAQRRILEALRHAQGLRDEDLKEISPRWRQAMTALGARGWAIAERLDCLAARNGPFEPPPVLTEVQQTAVNAIGAVDNFNCLLLHGVTGSGKTEIYLRAIGRMLERGRQTLVLVPEIGLTPQLIARFRRRFAVPIAVLHSGLTEQQRLCAWLMARAGSAPIVLGTRSAVFAPLASLGLIVVDEEHDASYKQQEGFRYHARDVAVMRASREGIPIVLGSATPSLESLQRAHEGGYRLLELPDRTGTARLPEVRLLDMRRLKPDQGLSHPLREAIAQRRARGEQVLLFLNRRGFAPVWMCYACGWAAPCERCDARLTLHKRSGQLRCHHCGADQTLIERCPACHGADLHALGEGTERIEAALAKYFPDARIERIDRDSTRRKGALEEKLGRAQSGEAHILVGTQMLSKGHDFPNVTLVGVLNADQGLYNADFRSPERLFQQIMQVSGRAGRADKPGEVLIQTWHPEHPIFAALARHDFRGFTDYALSERRETRYPPYSHLALLRAEATKPGAALSFLIEAQVVARRLHRDRIIEVMDPAPAPMERRAGRYRAQLLVQSVERKALHRFLDAWIARLMDSKQARRVRWSLDVDPIDMY